MLDFQDYLSSHGIILERLEFLIEREKQELYPNGLPANVSCINTPQHSTDVSFVKDGYPFGLMELNTDQISDEDIIVLDRGVEIIAENMMVMKNPIALCVYGGLQGDFNAYLLGLKGGRLCSLMNELVLKFDDVNLNDMEIFEFLALALKFIEDYDHYICNEKELSKMNQRRVSFFLEHPIHSSFMHTSMKSEDGKEWCKVFPVGFHDDTSLTSELLGSASSTGCNLYFNQEICAVEVRRPYLEECTLDGFQYLNLFINKINSDKDIAMDAFEDFGTHYGRAIASADNTHLDFRPANALLTFDNDEFDAFMAGKHNNLFIREVKLIDWANSIVGPIVHNRKRFIEAAINFRMYIVIICGSLSTNDMQFVLKHVFEGFVEGVGTPDKEECIEFRKLKSFLLMEFENESWNFFHRSLKSDLVWKKKQTLLRKWSFELAVASLDHNPLTTFEDTPDHLGSMKSLNIKLNRENECHCFCTCKIQK
eukprot:TRINITY_DN3350_c0_g2_i1.p1 TRINITY_DN3350_c0_g2~~TRINITY_DN3350_c0_g2_i1.p1  ORF type:complete len:481 (-),score=105.89 TRINITY_DN3350_c0_g2_i1:699-2141(-)